MDKYIIDNRDEETYCECCGYPLMVGDTAIMSYTGAVYCSGRCLSERDAIVQGIDNEIKNYERTDAALYVTYGLGG